LPNILFVYEALIFIKYSAWTVPGRFEQGIASLFNLIVIRTIENSNKNELTCF
jgi:hypothetical protein